MSGGDLRHVPTRHGWADRPAATPATCHPDALAGMLCRRACRRLDLCRFRSGFGPFHLWKNRNSPVARAGSPTRIMWMTSCPQARLAELSSRCMDPGITRHMRPGSGACRSRMPSRLNGVDIARISSPCIPRSWSRPIADRAARWRPAPAEERAAGASGIAAPAGLKRSPTVNAPGRGRPDGEAGVGARARRLTAEGQDADDNAKTRPCRSFFKPNTKLPTQGALTGFRGTRRRRTIRETTAKRPSRAGAPGCPRGP
jgi:hypothetical protein